MDTATAKSVDSAGRRKADKKRKKSAVLLREIKKEWGWLLKYGKRYTPWIVLYALLGLLGTAMGLGSGVASKRLIDAVVSHSSGALVDSIMLIAILAISQLFLTAVTSRITSLVGTRISTEIRGDIYARILLADWQEISKFHSGELVNRLEGDVNAVCSGIISFIPSIFTRTAQFIGSLCIVLYYDRVMAILALLSAPAVLLSSRFMMRMMRKYNRESREMNGNILSYGEESFQNLQTIKAFGLTRQYAENFKGLLSRYRKQRLDYDKFSILMTLCLSGLGLIVSYTCYGWGVWRLWQGAITYGTMTLFLQTSGTLSASFSALVSLAPSAVSIATSAGRIMEVTELTEENGAEGALTQEQCDQAASTGLQLVAEGVTFSYRQSKKSVLQNMCFQASSGEVIAFIGPSGEGKTTILRLLLGLLQPDSGALWIKIGEGKPLPVSAATRKLYSYVPQGNSMFSGTVADNLRMARPEATDEALEEALKTADAWSFISQLPNGIYTAIGERGINFSEGQAQRLAIARAILRSAPILLLDEATSALDSDTEARLLRNIMRSESRRICIVTTHRASILKYCTRIYKVDQNGTLLQWKRPFDGKEAEPNDIQNERRLRCSDDRRPDRGRTGWEKDH